MASTSTRPHPDEYLIPIDPARPAQNVVVITWDEWLAFASAVNLSDHKAAIEKAEAADQRLYRSSWMRGWNEGAEGRGELVTLELEVPETATDAELLAAARAALAAGDPQ